MEPVGKSSSVGVAAVRTVSAGNKGLTSTGGVDSTNTVAAPASAVALLVSADSAAIAAAVPGSYSGVSTHKSSMQGEEDAGVIAAPPAAATPALLTTSSSGSGPAEIPPEPSSEGLLGENDADVERQEDDDDDDDESEYEYEDDADAAFSSFLVDHPGLAATAAGATLTTNQVGRESPARIRDEEEYSAAVTMATNMNDNDSCKDNTSGKPKWREPSREAVSMSLRAEREKTGSKRRLAQDLYRIMNQDTEEAGFSIAPKSEDNMDHWIIKLFLFDPDSNLAKDMLVLGFEHVELEMTFPEQYPFEPPFVRVVRPRFKRQTGFVMNGALCMELLTKDGWNPVNDIESVIVSIRSLLVVGDGRLQAAYDMSESKYQARLKAGKKGDEDTSRKRQKKDDDAEKRPAAASTGEDGGSYSVAEAHAAYSHLSDYHKKKGWDSSGWWARKG